MLSGTGMHDGKGRHMGVMGCECTNAMGGEDKGPDSCKQHASEQGTWGAASKREWVQAP